MFGAEKILIEKQRLSPEEFLRLKKQQPHNIKYARPVPAKACSENLIEFEVTYKTPIINRAFY